MLSQFSGLFFTVQLLGYSSQEGVFIKEMADRARLARLRSPPLSAGKPSAYSRLPADCRSNSRPVSSNLTHALNTKKHPKEGAFIKEMADRVRFELTVRFRRTHDFQSCAFDHSAIYPATTTIKHI